MLLLALLTFSFPKKGVHEIQKNTTPFDDFFMLAVELGADDVEERDDAYVVISPPESLYEIKEALESKGYIYTEADIQYIPKSLVTVSQEDQEKNEALIDFFRSNR